LLKKFRELLTLICLEDEYFLFTRFTTAKLDFFFKASATNLFPSTLLPWIAKKTSFFFIILELMEISLIYSLLDIFDFDCSLIIFSFKSFDKDLFFNFIDSRIIF
jgi:hypothetical protein